MFPSKYIYPSRAKVAIKPRLTFRIPPSLYNCLKVSIVPLYFLLSPLKGFKININAQVEYVKYIVSKGFVFKKANEGFRRFRRLLIFNYITH